MQAQQVAYEAALAEERRYNYIRGLSIQKGNPIPAMQFPMAPPPTTPPVSILKTL